MKSMGQSLWDMYAPRGLLALCLLLLANCSNTGGIPSLAPAGKHDAGATISIPIQLAPDGGGTSISLQWDAEARELEADAPQSLKPDGKVWEVYGSIDALLMDVPGTEVAKPDVVRAEVAPTRTGVWLKGDWHAHSNHSLDAKDSPVATVLAKAVARGLDYFVLTDHDNHVQGNISTWSDPEYRSSQLLLLYGVEWTSGLGHANIFGTRPFDYAPLWAARENAHEAMQAAHAQGLHFSINHPAAKDWWEPGFAMDFDSLEVWTAPFVVPNSNSKALELWDKELMQGRRIPARGGSDCHHQSDLFESRVFNVGNPTTWVYARERTPAAILEGLAAGRASVSYAPGAERIDFSADADGDGEFESRVGDVLRTGTGNTLSFRITIEGFRTGATYSVRVVKNGLTFQSVQLTSPTFSFDDASSAAETGYYRVEVRGQTILAATLGRVAFGDFIALTNPIYIASP